MGGSNAYPDPAPKKWVGPDPEKLIGSTPLASMAGGHSDRYSGGLMSGWNLFCPLTGVGPICCGRICTTAGASQGNPREEGPADPGQPGPSPKGGGGDGHGPSRLCRHRLWSPRSLNYRPYRCVEGRGFRNGVSSGTGTRG